MNSENLQWLFGIHDNVLKVNLEGVTHEESLKRPEAGGNCINWVIGHLLNSREAILAFLDQMWSVPEASKEVYERGASGNDFGKFLPLEKLIELWEESQTLLISALEGMTPEKFAETAPVFGYFTKPDTRERRVMFLYFHESYHLGQLGLMRRLVGKEGAIK